MAVINFNDSLPKGQTIPLDMVQVVEYIRGCVQRDHVPSLAEKTGLVINAIYMFRRGATYYPEIDVMNALIRHYLPHAKIVIPAVDAPAPAA